MRHPRTLLTLLVGSVVVTACLNPLTVQEAPSRGPLQQAFADAAGATGVPEPLLLAVGYVESRWQMNEGALVDEEHGRGAVGLMGIVDRSDDPRLARAAADAGVDVDAARTDAVAHVHAAAFGLRRLALERHGALPDTLAGWRETLIAWGADGDAEVGDGYVDAVFAVMATGARGTASTGEALVLVGSGGGGAGARRTQAITADSGLVDRVIDARQGFFTRGRSRAIDRVVIHTTEGSYDGAISWFRSPNNPYQTSAHYVVRSSDGQITQMVDEADTAHHVLTWNSRSIGIEHEAISAQPQWFTEAMLRRSAALVRDICARHGIPMDREHIVGHVEVPGNDHTDPGRHWDWDRFMALVIDGQSAPPAPPRDGFCDDGRFGGWCDGGDLVDCGPSSSPGLRGRTTCEAGCQVMPAGQPDRCLDPAPPPPPPSSDPCGGETYEGRCDGATLVWCEASTVRRADCGARGLACGWQDDSVGHNCVAAPPPDPCAGETWAGRCEGRTLIWCEADTVKTTTCRSTCGWQDDSIGNNCL